MSETSKTILILVGPEYEDLEVWYPKLRLEEAGFETKLAGIGEKGYRGKHGYPATMDGHVRDFPAAQLGGIIAPGGWAPDKLRRDLDVLTRVREVHAAGKLVGTICHGPWVLISAGIVRGRTLTSTLGIRDDVINAGATWVDRRSRTEISSVLASRRTCPRSASRCSTSSRASARALPSRLAGPSCDSPPND